MLNNIIPDYTPLNRSHIASISISITNMYTIDLSGIIIRNVEILNVIVFNWVFFNIAMVNLINGNGNDVVN